MTLKVRLLLGAAAPLVFTLPAVAQVTISTATTTPIQTSTANNGAASDVTIASGGSITLTTEGSTGVTVDSDNDLINNGAITTNNANNSVGVRIQAGRTGSYSGTGAISILEDYTRTDTDNDSDLDGPLALGTGRVGLLVEGSGAFTGDIRLSRTNAGVTPAASATITVEGNDSYGVSIRSNLNGSYIQQGAVSVTGSNSVGVDIRGNVSGDVQISGGASVRGENAIGARILGNVGGEFMVGGAITSTGFVQGEASNYEDPDLADDNDTGSDEPAKLDPDDLLNNGSALEVRGSLAYGFLVNGAAVGTTDPTDDVKDVIQDFNENRTTGSIVTFGSAPALLIQAQDGTGGASIVLDNVRETIRDSLDDDKDSNFDEVIGVFNYDFGFVNRGIITSSGVNMGFSSTAVRIAGSADGTHTTTIDGGLFNGGTIQARAFEADATALQLGLGAITPTIHNTGTIRADVNTETTHDAYGLRIGAGANVSSVVNDGLLLASVRGYDGDAYAFQDLSGTVTSFTNSSRIVAGYVDDDTTDDITSGNGVSVAIDLRNNTSGVLITQNDTVDNARISGNVLTGSGNDRFDLLSGEVVGLVNFGAGADTLNISSATLNGVAKFEGTGATVAVSGGKLIGGLDLGVAAGSLSFVNGSEFSGDLTRASSAGAVALNVNNSTFNNLADGTLNLSSMTFANGAQIGLAIDNARVNGNVPLFNVAGTASIAADTRFTPIFDQFTNQGFTLRVLDAASLSLAGPVGDMLNENGPYLFNMELVQPNANAIDLVLSVKSAAQLGLNTRQADAYDAILDLMEQDNDIAAAVTSISAAADFRRGWADMLPANDVSVMRVLASNASAAFGATANRLDMISRKPDAPGGAWAEEFGVYHAADASADSVGISGGGFGVAAGVDVLSTGTALVGAFLALESAELEEDDRTAAPLNVAQTSVGAYGGWINGNFALNAAASVGFIDFTSERDVELGALSDTLRGSWRGQSYSAAGRATYTVPLGWLDVKPFVGADYIGFNQDGYTETATTNDGLAIIAGDSDASLTTASAGLHLVGNLGGDAAFTMRPELSVGYRSVLDWQNTPASLRFAGGPAASTFSLTSGVEPEDALTAGLGLTIDSQFLNIKLGYDAEIADSSMTHYGSITFRMAFW